MTPHLIVPGWGGSGPEHWQSLWQRDLGATRIGLVDWLARSIDTWVDAIEDALVTLARRDPQPPVLVAHSLGCIAVAHWARRFHRPVRAALLVAPADVERAPCIPRLAAFGPVPSERLPFPSLVIASDDDPHAALERAQAFAAMWGSDWCRVNGGGHLNAASGLGRWRFGRAMLAHLLARTDYALSA